MDFSIINHSFRFTLILFAIVNYPVYAGLTLTAEQVLQRVLQSQPSLEVALLQVERARLEIPAVNSQLGWVLNGQAGTSRELSFTGTSLNRIDVGAGIQRKLSSGSTVGVDTSYSREDSEIPFFASYPNPANTTKLDFNYRTPLGQGSANPGYQHELISAEASTTIAIAEGKKLRDQLSIQALNLFYSGALTIARMKNAEAAIDRSRRLRKFIEKNIYLGVNEKKDRLQIDALLHGAEADLKSLRVTWEQQRTALNRLIGQPWQVDFTPDLGDLPEVDDEIDKIMEQVLENSHDLAIETARLEITEAYINRNRDQQRNKLDLVFSVGGRNINGGAAIGNVNLSDYAGGLRLEFSRALNRQGVDARLNQAQLDRSIALKQIQDIKMALDYQVNGLLSEISATKAALTDSETRLASEKNKYKEGNSRYRTGRTDISELIQFENDLRLAQLGVDIKRIELIGKHAEVELLRGSRWSEIEAPVDRKKKNK
ncbi:MAG: hypothetical protein BMS9Abin33_0940 [Gammaproteobacteria bacterium]|nr:MAG: hypothetical protein BMS9Abin33_0940 [Gammaproteobacteria bacterium]